MSDGSEALHGRADHPQATGGGGGAGEGVEGAQASRKLGISEQTCYRWRKQYGGMQVNQARRLKELERENARLRKLLAVSERRACRVLGRPRGTQRDCARASDDEARLVARMTGLIFVHTPPEIRALLEKNGIREMEEVVVRWFPELDLGNYRTASVITETPSVIYRLSAGALHRMESDEPSLAIALHHFMSRILTERLSAIHRTLRSLTR